MHQPFAIARENISGSVAIELRNMVVDGRLAPGERINEVHLAKQLGVSRTPLREALARLSNEGALRMEPRIGYFVRALTVDEFEQVYTIRELLDPEALRLAGIPSSDRLARLEVINDSIGRARDVATIIDLDDEFHAELVADCPNRVLIDLIRQFSHRTRCYELALMRERTNVEHSIAGHGRLLRELHDGRLESACDELRQNMRSGRAPVIDWLTKRESHPVAASARR